jgi:diaminohydroxyphosphoribosylaminopyrimidine deaminase/5-amino-6-(5-phosphoribosylamino)uracil reductase
MDYMARALHLAARALGSSSPNPAVGAVLVRDGEIVGEGWTQRPGQPHAEVMALNAAGDSARGATLYVTLEPCAHQGRTPPCAAALIAAGIRQANLAMIDPSPWVNGAGRAALEGAGIKTTVGTYADQAKRLNEGYLTWVALGRPFVTAVYAMSMDGAIYPNGAEPNVGALARAELERLRARADRSLVGVPRLLADDPRLAKLAAAGVTSLVIDCNGADLSALVEAGLADKVVVLLTPRFAGRADRPSDGLLANELELRELAYERLGGDLMMVGYTGACSAA